MTEPKETEIPEPLQEQLKFFAQTEELLRNDLASLQRQLRNTRRFAALAVLLAALAPLAIRYIPLRSQRVVTEELVVEDGSDSRLVLTSTASESGLYFRRGDATPISLTAGDQENRLHLAAFTAGADGITLSSNRDTTGVTLSHEPARNASENRVALISDKEGGRVETRGNSGAAVLGGAVPTLRLTSPEGSIIATADKDAKLQLEKKDAGTITLATTSQGPRLSLMRGLIAELFVAGNDAGLHLTGDGASDVLVAANEGGKGPVLRTKSPGSVVVADRDGFKVTSEVDGKKQEATLSASKAVRK